MTKTYGNMTTKGGKNTNIEECYQQYESAREQLAVSLSRGRSVLLGMLGTIKGGVR